jgi:hypothetical protein
MPRIRRRPFGAFPPLLAATAILASVASMAIMAVLSGCAVLESLTQRAGVFGLRFSLDQVDVSHLVYPDDFLSATLSLISPGRSLLRRIGVDIHCDVKASNPRPSRVVFDGGTGHLRVKETSASDPAASGSIPAFSVGPNSDTLVRIIFPLRLDNPVFAKAAWKAIVRGQNVPYKVDAEMRFHLLGGALGLPDSTRAVTLNVAKGSVNAKAAGGSAVDRFLKLLDAVL